MKKSKLHLFFAGIKLFRGWRQKAQRHGGSHKFYVVGGGFQTEKRAAQVQCGMTFQDRRRSPRTFLAATFSFIKDSDECRGQLVDISTGGMRFTSKTPLETGDVLTGSIPFPNGLTQRVSALILDRQGTAVYTYRAVYLPSSIEPKDRI